MASRRGASPSRRSRRRWDAEPRDHVRLAPEPGQRLLVVEQLARERLERERAVHAHVPHLVDAAHPAVREQPHDLVPPTDHLSNQRIHSRRCSVARVPRRWKRGGAGSRHQALRRRDGLRRHDTDVAVRERAHRVVRQRRARRPAGDRAVVREGRAVRRAEELAVARGHRDALVRAARATA